MCPATYRPKIMTFLSKTPILIKCETTYIQQALLYVIIIFFFNNEANFISKILFSENCDTYSMDEFHIQLVGKKANNFFLQHFQLTNAFILQYASFNTLFANKKKSIIYFGNSGFIFSLPSINGFYTKI